ncbi:MAG: Gfo/Idh/MocA family oxidoreductase [Pyrinomonadaceae bacterium]
MKDLVGVGVIGTGFARRIQVPAFLACEDTRVVSVASGSEMNARETADEFGIGHFTTDWRDTVGHADVDLVCITTPPNLHREITLAAIANGKHILCEKPMAMNVAEATEMTDAARGKTLLALIDHELRFQPGRQLAYKMLRDGVIGKVRHAKSIFQAPHRGDASLPWNWWSDETAGGGALGAIASHVIDSFHWFLDTDISSVFCQLHTHVKERADGFGDVRPVTSDDESNMLLRFKDSHLADHATGLVSISMVEGPAYGYHMDLYGEGGSMRIGALGELSIAYKGDKELSPIEVPLGTSIAGVPDTGFARAFVEFAPIIVRAIRSGEYFVEHAATFADGLRVQRVLEASRASDRTGSAVSVS